MLKVPLGELLSLVAPHLPGNAAVRPEAVMRSYSGLLDLDLPRLARGGLAQSYRQDAVVQGRVDLVRVDVSGHCHHELELPDPPRLAAQHSRAFLLPDLAGDPNFVVTQLDVDVVPVDSGGVDLEHIRVIGLFDVRRWNPHRRLLRAESAHRVAEEVADGLAHLILKLFDLGYRVS